MLASCWAIGRSSVDATNACRIRVVRAVRAALLSCLPRLAGLWLRDDDLRFAAVVTLELLWVLFWELFSKLFREPFRDLVFAPLDSVSFSPPASVLALLDSALVVRDAAFPLLAAGFPFVVADFFLDGEVFLPEAALPLDAAFPLEAD